MMGVYVHVPFCRRKCFYCGFYSVASLVLKKAYLEAITREMVLRRGYLEEVPAETLYLGGGTPSCLELPELEVLVNALEGEYSFARDAERTIEMNPEDLTREKLLGLRALGFNRVSVGVQSFSDERLKQVNRGHTGGEAVRGIERAAGVGFENISMDLIIGLPGQTEAEVRAEVEQACRLPVQHVSVYMLSVDPGTVFAYRQRRGELPLVEDDRVAAYFQLTCEILKEHGFTRYEISNFARNGKYSRHNTAYWRQQPYIGLGPSAHSYDLDSRQWNVSQLRVYVEHLRQGKLAYEWETLDERDLYNEYVMTNLRTMWGVEETVLWQRYGACFRQAYPFWQRYLERGELVRAGSRIRVSEAGWLISDAIFSDLFVV